MLESLELEADEGAEAAWAQEIERRIAELDAGKAVDFDLGRGSRKIASQRWLILAVDSFPRQPRRPKQLGHGMR
ncbi:MAG: addiction module protein [Gammaproteobacteria bacterium]|nr:addiction module protein [Gammaproteobacteria bacterium]